MQMSLFATPSYQQPPTLPAYANGSTTSLAAAKAIAKASPALRAKVLAFIKTRGRDGVTDQELAVEMGILSDTARARRCELRDAGKIADSGRRRPSPSGRASTVWVAVEVL